ncbi:4Fe-4S binding protein [Gordonia humi]|uniref:Ferredoxin--NADP+ reductase n=1 Tax=Gordonia humi TaxID=686429 RepID=A0A840FE49_9ACTN|nr:4Fe-4S binding protein [Gordonia humi]MBB4137717.1 ferredoxin--NADP+ reductase [Gordonia humi]
MVHVITASCCSDAGCVSVCPVDCIHPTPDEPGFGTSEILHIDPQTCIDCGACADACPVDAIFPAERLGTADRVFVDLNADYYRDRPDAGANPPQVVYPDIPRLPDGLRVAIVGTGPAGGYALTTLIGRTDAQITVIDRLPTPGGLVRAGVAPDHPGTKGVLRTFDLAYRDPRVDLIGGLAIGDGPGAVSHPELAAHFDAVFYAVGAPAARSLGIPGEDLPGSTSAGDLVAWYNAVPGAVGAPPAADCGRTVIVGTGNVALDIARILVSSPETLAATDIADRAVDLLRRQDVREVVLLGRRGPADAAYSDAEYRALQALPDVDLIVCDDAATIAELGLDRPPAPGRRRIVFLFGSVPTEIVADGSGRAGAVDVTTGSISHRIRADLVVRSVGYRGVAVPGLPFDDVAGVIPTVDGRVTGADGAPVPGLYAVGWAARGARGGIGANKAHAVAAVESFVADAAAGSLPRSAATREYFTALVRRRAPDVVDYRGAAVIDRIERARGRIAGRPRIKFTDVREMSDAARSQPHLKFGR